MCGVCGCDQTETKLISVEQDLLAENNHYATINRKFFNDNNIRCINMVSSPGAGKTTLLVNTILSLNNPEHIYVIEGDPHTELDADRIRKTGVTTKQINTGKTCHLTAHRIQHTIESMQIKPNSLLFIENVGNLICPALFDLGETQKVALLSTAEGDDKPLKYPDMFVAADLIIINKMDLLPLVNFDVNKCITDVKTVNPKIHSINLTATKLNSLSPWLQWLN